MGLWEDDLVGGNPVCGRKMGTRSLSSFPTQSMILRFYMQNGLSLHVCVVALSGVTRGLTKLL